MKPNYSKIQIPNLCFQDPKKFNCL
uniref:Uncharacterized protein n=1 Tax=Rhizophora mucronata TaxID=61149 RepID=A0A2P2JF71_RHIMU